MNNRTSKNVFKRLPIQTQSISAESPKMNFLKTAAFAFAILAGTGSLFAQVPAPAPPQSGPVALTGGMIHTVSGSTYENGTVVFDQGRIVAVGIGVEIPAGATTVDLAGQHLYPGMFEAYSQLGLTEISSVAATIDHSESGALNPNVQAVVAVNPDSELIPVTRAGGVLLAVTAPTGGLVSGKSAVIQMDGWTWEDMTLLADSAMHVNWPSSSSGRRRRGPPVEEGTNRTGEAIRQLRELFDQARNYEKLRGEAGAGQAVDLRLEGMADLTSGRMPMMVRADQLNDIQAAVSFAAEQKVRLIILGGYDAPLCADLLKKHDVPVIVSAVYRNPMRRGDPDDHAYSLPRRLHEAGVRFCISCTDRSENWNTRTLPLHAGTAIAFGLPAEEALKSVTLYPAQIMNVADRVGSIEAGKDATIIVTDGDPLDTRTHVTAAYIQGRTVDLSSKHTRLNEKYKQKYGQPGHLPPGK